MMKTIKCKSYVSWERQVFELADIYGEGFALFYKMEKEVILGLLRDNRTGHFKPIGILCRKTNTGTVDMPSVEECAKIYHQNKKQVLLARKAEAEGAKSTNSIIESD